MGWVKGVWNGIEENLRWAGGMIGISEPYEPGQSSSVVESVQKQKEKEAVVEASTSSSGGGGGWFSGLRGAMSTRSDGGSRSSRGTAPPGTYKIGEVKAEYVKVSLCSSSMKVLLRERD